MSTRSIPGVKAVKTSPVMGAEWYVLHGKNLTNRCFLRPVYCEGNIVPVHKMREYEVLKVQLHSFLKSPKHGGECPASRRAYLVPV